MTTTAAVFFIFRLFIFLFCFVLLLLSFYLSFLFFLSPTIIYEDKRNRKRKKKYFEKKKYENLTGTPPPLPFIAGCWRINKKKNRTRIFIKRKTKDDGSSWKSDQRQQQPVTTNDEKERGRIQGIDEHSKTTNLEVKIVKVFSLPESNEMSSRLWNSFVIANVNFDDNEVT